MDKEYKTRVISGLIVVGIVILGVTSYLGYYFNMQKNVSILSEGEFSIPELTQGERLKNTAKRWVTEYINQFMKEYVPKDKAVSKFKILDTEVIDSDNMIVRVSFKIEKKSINTDFFDNFGNTTDYVVNCDWLITLKEKPDNNVNKYFATRAILPSNEKFKIYQITEYKTAFVYDSNLGEQLKLVYSDDGGKTFLTSKIKNKKFYSTVTPKFINFVDNKLGYMLVMYDRAMSKEATIILETKDGGATFSEISEGPTSAMVKEVKFIDNLVGFIKYSDGSLYRTEDGGKTFSEIIIEPRELEEYMGVRYEFSSVYRYKQIPEIEDNILILKVKQGGNDYKGGNTALRYVSKDKGKTWEYLDEIID